MKYYKKANLIPFYCYRKIRWCGILIWSQKKRMKQRKNAWFAYHILHCSSILQFNFASQNSPGFQCMVFSISAIVYLFHICHSNPIYARAIGFVAVARFRKKDLMKTCIKTFFRNGKYSHHGVCYKSHNETSLEALSILYHRQVSLISYNNLISGLPFLPENLIKYWSGLAINRMNVTYGECSVYKNVRDPFY